MSVTQLSVFIENIPGRLAAATRILGQAGVNIRGYSIADTEDYGILRLLVDKELLASEVLRANDFTVHTSEVLLARVPDQPGGLADTLDALAALEINVEYTYATANTLIVFGVNRRTDAEKALQGMGIHLYNNEELAQL